MAALSSRHLELWYRSTVPPHSSGHTSRDTCLYAARLPRRFLYPSNTPVTRVCTQRDSQDAYDTCFVLSRTFCPARATANTWQSYSKSVVVPLAYVVPRVCTRRRSRPRRGCTSESKRTHRAGCQGYLKPPSVPAAASPRPAQRPGLVLIRFVPCLHPPCALVGLDGRPPSSRDFAWPRCFAHAWPFQRRWVYAGYAQMIALAAPVGVATAPGVRILSCSISCN